jgi:hypothetical protein
LICKWNDILIPTPTKFSSFISYVYIIKKVEWQAVG